VREAIQMENLPLEVHIAPDGEQALEFFARAETDPEAPSPHLLLVDLNLPKVDGLEVLRRIRASEKYKHIPAFIITSSDSAADRDDGAKLGAGYFQKPPNYQEFLKLGTFLKRFLEDNKLL